MMVKSGAKSEAAIICYWKAIKWVSANNRVQKIVLVMRHDMIAHTERQNANMRVQLVSSENSTFHEKNENLKKHKQIYKS